MKLFPLLLLAAAGCVAYSVDPRPVVTLEEVERMTAEGVDANTQIARIRGSQLPKALTADDVIRLKNKQVADSVIQELAAATPKPVPAVYVEPSVSFSYGYSPWYGSYYPYYAYPYGYRFGYYPYYGHYGHYHGHRRYYGH